MLDVEQAQVDVAVEAADPAGTGSSFSPTVRFTVPPQSGSASSPPLPADTIMIGLFAGKGKSSLSISAVVRRLTSRIGLLRWCSPIPVRLGRGRLQRLRRFEAAGDCSGSALASPSWRALLREAASLGVTSYRPRATAVERALPHGAAPRLARTSRPDRNWASLALVAVRRRGRGAELRLEEAISRALRQRREAGRLML